MGSTSCGVICKIGTLSSIQVQCMLAVLCSETRPTHKADPSAKPKELLFAKTPRIVRILTS